MLLISRKAPAAADAPHRLLLSASDMALSGPSAASCRPAMPPSAYCSPFGHEP
jgi:hypothetical protein